MMERAQKPSPLVDEEGPSPEILAADPVE